jgi:hypothetical protein
MDKLLTGAQICCQCRKDDESRGMAVTQVSRSKDFGGKSPRSGYAGTGACFLLNSQGLLVFRVAAPASSAHEAVLSGMLREGDILIKVDGEEMQGRHISEIATKLLGQPMTTVQLTFQRGHEMVTINLQRRLSAPTSSNGGVSAPSSSLGGLSAPSTNGVNMQRPSSNPSFETPPFREEYGRRY